MRSRRRRVRSAETGETTATVGKKGEKGMPAYIIVQGKLHNTDWMAEYGPKAHALLDKHGGETVIVGNPTPLEGEQRENDIGVILKFPSGDAARNFYGDPEYAPLIKLRQSGSDSVFTLLEPRT